jgi:hypothetical protein
MRQQHRVERSDNFTDLDQSDSYGIEHHAVVETTTTKVGADRVGRGNDVVQALRVPTAHSGIASASTWSRMPSLSESMGTTSTSTPSRSASSRVIPARATSPTSGPSSTSRSMSLVAVSSPRATLPNSLGLCAPRRASTSTTARRRRRSRRPRGVSGSPRRSATAGRTSTTSSCPAASTNFESIRRPGSRRPASYALITGWATPARRASSDCERPAALRAARISAPESTSQVAYHVLSMSRTLAGPTPALVFTRTVVLCAVSLTGETEGA